MIVGIDLGTTNSAAAVWRDGAATLIPNRLGETLTPSAVSLDGDTLIVGRAARERQATHPATTVTAFRRFMSTGRRIELGNRAFSPKEISAEACRSIAWIAVSEPASRFAAATRICGDDIVRRLRHHDATREIRSIANLLSEVPSSTV